jgi:hypothetical protein
LDLRRVASGKNFLPEDLALKSLLEIGGKFATNKLHDLVQ